MNNELKYNYIKRLWHLQDGVIYTRWGNKPVAFASKDKDGRRFVKIEINDKAHTLYIHEAAYMLHHNRPITEGMVIHHVDGNYENNNANNLAELTPKQHRRIHTYQIDDPMRGIYLNQGAWTFKWMSDDGKHRTRRFHGINEALAFRDEIERPRRQELRALGLNCRKVSRGITASELRRISRQQNTRLWRAHI